MSKDIKNPAITINQAATLSGLKIDMITYLGRVDILKPALGGGRGSRRLFTFNDVIFLRLIAEMLSKGIQVSKLKSSLNRARSEAASWIDIRQAPRRYLISDGTEIFVRRKGQLESKTMNGQLAFAFVLDLGTTHKQVADAWPQGGPKRVTRVNQSPDRRAKIPSILGRKDQ
jgi:DNA-binding transcriptional MerR regulator